MQLNYEPTIDANLEHEELSMIRPIWVAGNETSNLLRTSPVMPVMPGAISALISN